MIPTVMVVGAIAQPTGHRPRRSCLLPAAVSASGIRHPADIRFAGRLNGLIAYTGVYELALPIEEMDGVPGLEPCAEWREQGDLAAVVGNGFPPVHEHNSPGVIDQNEADGCDVLLALVVENPTVQVPR